MIMAIMGQNKFEITCFTWDMFKVLRLGAT